MSISSSCDLTSLAFDLLYSLSRCIAHAKKILVTSILDVELYEAKWNRSRISAPADLHLKFFAPQSDELAWRQGFGDNWRAVCSKGYS
jgi:hypothetical protein